MTPKETLRREIKKYLKAASGEEYRSQGINAAVLLRSSPVWSRYNTVFLFLSIGLEIDTLPLLETVLRDGKKAFAPGVEAERLVFYPLLSADGPWRKGRFGIREPANHSPGAGEWKPAAAGDFPALIFAPGLAFDREGNRLGRGGGYYDRFFADLDAAGRQYNAIGLCMDFQITGRVPAGELDKKMNGLLTGTQLVFFT